MTENEKFFDLCKDKAQFMKAYAMDEAIKHLSDAKYNDSRKRERKRADVALSTINKWLNKGAKAYEQTKRSKVPAA